MGITHVIRGQEFLASTPKYLNLYDALDIPRPIFASVPPIMNEQGTKKLAKRDGAKDILAYREEGYLTDAILNFLASLGWNDGTEQEVFTRDELIEKFSLKRVQKSGATIDEKRLLWLNGAHIRNTPVDKLYEYVSPREDNPQEDGKQTGFWPESAYAPNITKEYRMKVLTLAQDRLKMFEDLHGFSYFFADPEIDTELIDGNKQLRKLTDDERRELLSIARQEFEKITDWTPETIQNCLNELLETTGQKPGILF